VEEPAAALQVDVGTQHMKLGQNHKVVHNETSSEQIQQTVMNVQKHDMNSTAPCDAATRFMYMLWKESPALQKPGWGPGSISTVAFVLYDKAKCFQYLKKKCGAGLLDKHGFSMTHWGPIEEKKKDGFNIKDVTSQYDLEVDTAWLNQGLRTPTTGGSYPEGKHVIMIYSYTMNGIDMMYVKTESSRALSAAHAANGAQKGSGGRNPSQTSFSPGVAFRENDANSMSYANRCGPECTNKELIEALGSDFTIGNAVIGKLEKCKLA